MLGAIGELKDAFILAMEGVPEGDFRDWPDIEGSASG
jgi:hypothetical protein